VVDGIIVARKWNVSSRFFSFSSTTKSDILLFPYCPANERVAVWMVTILLSIYFISLPSSKCVGGIVCFHAGVARPHEFRILKSEGLGQAGDEKQKQIFFVFSRS
jgi:hypothetical protein